MSDSEKTEKTSQPAHSTSGTALSAVQREVERVFDEFSRGWPFRGGGEGALSPKVDMRESDGTVEITAELPGMTESDIDVSVAGRTVRISGEKKSETTREEADFHLMERSYGRFSRSIGLGFAPDPDKVEAQFKDGVLTLTIPKPAEANEETRKISVKRAG